MNGSQLLALGTSVCDRIAGLSDTDLFDVFNVDMTESFYLRQGDDKYLGDNMGRVERVRVMKRTSGQKTSERMLWNLSKPTGKTQAELDAIERAAIHARIDAAYAANKEYELDIDDAFAFATAMVKANVIHPSHLVNDDGELD